MLHKSLLALVLGATLALSVSTAQADLMKNQPIPISGASMGNPALPNTGWGSIAHAPGLPFPPGPQHPFGGLTVYDDQVFGPGFQVTVTSGAIPIPPGKRFAGFLQVDFTNWVPNDYLFHTFVFGPFKDQPDDNPINTLTLIGVGVAQADTTNGTISWMGFQSALMGNPIVRIEWTQVPAPGSLALLGMAGLVGNRRRRR